MRIGYAFSVAAIAVVAFGATAVLAQQDPIEARKAMMKGNGQATAAVAKMVKGEAPFDLATAKKSFATFEDAAVKDLDSLKAAFGNVSKNCGGCHETYRIKKS